MLLLGACSSAGGSENTDKIIIYTNADEEPVKIMEKTLDDNGYKGKYLLQSLGTSELGGKLLAEGNEIEADLVTMSTFYVDSAQEKMTLFKKLKLDVDPLQKIPYYAAPLTVQEGVIFYNSEALRQEKLPVPRSLKELADPKYRGHLSLSDINSSSTAWLLVQALVDNYGEDEAKKLIKGIHDNAGDHVEDSGSGPLKKVRVGEVAIGFGLRHQAIKDKKDGLPIAYVEPAEGTYSLTESLVVVDKQNKTNPEAEKMLNLLLTKARPEILKIYPTPVYKGESAEGLGSSQNEKVFPEPLTAELLQKHQKLTEEARGN